MEKKELKIGEKYLKVVVSLGNVDFDLAAFANLEATSENRQPNFKGRNIAVWVNKKQEKKVEPILEQVV